MLVTWGVIYALPNLYPPDFAIQISREEAGADVEELALEAIVDAFEEQGIQYFTSGVVEAEKLTFRFHDDEMQLRARDIAQRALHGLSNVYIVALNAAATTPAWLRSIGAEPMKYGLDLRGGVHFLMEVDTEKAVQDRVSGMESEIKRMLRQRNDRIRYSSVEKPADGALKFVFADSDLRDRARSKINEQYGEFDIQSGEDELPFVQLTVTEASIKEIEDFAVSQNLQTIRNRVNELGVSEPLVQRLGRNRIVVDLPGVQDAAEAKKILGKVATLEFRMEAMPDTPRSNTITQVYEGRDRALEKDVILRGDRVFDAQVGFDPDSGLPQVNITLDSDGGELMHRATRHSIGRRMAVIFIETKTRDNYEVVDGKEVLTQIPYVQKKVISLATVQAALGVKFRITGLDAGEARELALLLRAGALAADMFIAEERTVGASLGAENIRLGAISVTVGMILVLIFMFIYYRVFGLAANMALAVNLVLLVAVMSSLGATLTLPGIAGIVLTVGMAVDANVLIFSRIREELKNAVSPQAAINAGFERAFVTIMDANLTTLIVAVILYSIGTGPVKGFAVTLSIGILTSMFTAIMGTRALINLFYGGRNVRRLLI